jgi:methyl-accepting chemotaxis protein
MRTPSVPAARFAALAALGLALGLGACATNYDEQFAMVNNRLDTMNSRMDGLDARVQEAIGRADAAGQAANVAATEARTANQRVDQLGGRVDTMQRMPARSPRG